MINCFLVSESPLALNLIFGNQNKGYLSMWIKR
ncbi:MAG: hypothetical protein ACI8Z9_002531 [Paraglaciecola sp.]